MLTFRSIPGLSLILIGLGITPACDERPSGTGAGSLTASAATQSASTQPKQAWLPPTPKSAAERRDERERMVREQIERPGDLRTAVRDLRVLAAMRTAPRHEFVPKERRRLAYSDGPLPIGYGQTISQPYIVALMTMELGLGPDDKVLEVGTGSGYQAAVLAQLTPHVYTIEIVEPLHERAAATLAEQGYADVRCRAGDGYYGWKDEAPFDAIIVTAAAGHLPPPLWEQLKPGGRIVIPIGSPYEVQRLVVLTKTEDGKRRSRSITSCRFVPMTGRVQGD